MASDRPVNDTPAGFFNRMNWLKRVGVVLGAVFALLALVPFFVTLNDYIPDVEREISAVLGEPVSIDNLHASALPVPHARIDGISIGNAQEIKIGKLTFTPALWSFLRSERVIRSVEVEDLVLSQKALGTLIALTRQNRTSSNIRIERIRLHGAIVKLEQSSFGPFDVQVRVSSVEKQGEVLLTTQDGGMKARLIPKGERYLIDIAGQAWTPPMGPAIRFDEINMKGVARNNGVDFNDVSAKLYGGTLAGRMTIGWHEGVTLQGNLDLKQIELKQAAALVSPKTRLSGRVDAKPVFSSRADTVAQLDEALRIQTPFTVHHGVLYGFDVMRAATSLGGQGAAGGETRFEELSGHLVMERRSYRFTNLKIASGGVGARGNVTVSPSRALSGVLSTNIKALGKTASIPLTVAGTLDSPMLYPNPAALAGAAAGTAILGPGVGTAAGAKLGELVDGMLGKKNP